MATYVFTENEGWLSEMDESQYTKVEQYAEQNIEIIDAFCYDSANVGAEGVTFRFLDKDGNMKYTTTFSKVLVKQFKEGLLEAISKEPQTVKVHYRASKQGKKYPVFMTAY